MGYDDFRNDENVIHRFCAMHGHSAETKDMLLQRAMKRSVAFDDLQRLEKFKADHRFVPVTERQLQEWVVEASEGPTFGFN